jgi:hypothetical protein
MTFKKYSAAAKIVMIIEIKPCINKKMEWSTFGISPSVKIPQYPQERKFQNVIKNEASMIMNAIPFAYLRLYSCPKWKGSWLRSGYVSAL